MKEHMREIVPWLKAGMIELEWTDSELSMTRCILLRVDQIVYVHHLEEDRNMLIGMSDGTRLRVPECYERFRSVLADVSEAGKE